GVTTLGGAVGETAKLLSLTTDAQGTTAVNGGMVNATTVDFQDDVKLGANTTVAGTTVSFGKTVNDSTADTHTLLVNAGGVTTLGGAVGDTAELLSLTTDAGGTASLQSVTTTGGQSYGDTTVTLNGTYTAANSLFTVSQATVLAGTSTVSTGSGAISFGGTVDATTAGGPGLTANSSGATSFSGAVGGIKALASLTTDAGGTTAINGKGVATAGTQVYQDAVTLAGPNTTLSSTGSAVISFSTTVDGASALEVSTAGEIVFGGEVGHRVLLVSVTASGGGMTAINGGAVTTTGAQVYTGAVTLAGPKTTLSAKNSAPITFYSSVDGRTDLLVDTSGVTTFKGTVGSNLPLLSLRTNLGGTTILSSLAVTTVGNQTYGDALNVTSNTVLNAGDGNVEVYQLVSDSGSGSGSGTVTKQGSGTLTLWSASLAAVNWYVDGGTLLVNNPLGSGSGTGIGVVVVNQGGTLGGTGTIQGLVTVNSGGTIDAGAPGTVGTLTIQQGVVFQPGSKFTAQINGPSPDSGYDQLVVTGTVVLTGTVALNGPSLNGPSLNASLAFKPNVVEARFVLVVAQDVQGQFDRLPQNATYNLGGEPYQIFYNQQNPALGLAVADHNVVLQSRGFVAASQAIKQTTIRQLPTLALPPLEPPAAVRTPPPLLSPPLESITVGGETATDAERRVEVEALAPFDDRGNFKETTVLRLPVRVLRDPARLFARLPDGLYRIQLVEAAEGRVLEKRLVMEVFIRDGKPFERTDAAVRKPAPSAGHGDRAVEHGDSVEPQIPGLPGPPPQSRLDSSGGRGAKLVPDPQEPGGTPATTHLPVRSSSASESDLSPEEERATSAAVGWLPAGMTAAAATALRPRQVDAAIQRCSRRLLTKAVRLYRRACDADEPAVGN
ncbi:MAG: hypothetical protein NTY19_32335, partial [Planctomycetota bacterium]|nr:hypothetical protein [Planctomycetota bacterium]